LSIITDHQQAIFDADSHYWESSDAFTRYRDKKYADRGLRVVEVDGISRYFFGDRPHPILPGPGDQHGRPKPSSLFDFFAGKVAHDPALTELSSENPGEHPEWFNRDARLRAMDEQGVEATWLFPSHGVCVEGPMRDDLEASLHIISAFNRWIDDEWGLSYKDRIFSPPLISLSDMNLAIRELEWALSRGARLITMRNGPVFTARGMLAPADPGFDPFWARVEEAGITVTFHAGFDDGYDRVTDAVASSWGLDLKDVKDTTGILLRNFDNYANQFIDMLQKKRLVHDFAASLIYFGLFTRFPKLRVAYIENGALWVGPLLHALHVVHMQNSGMFAKNPVDQFHESCWVAPFVEDDVEELARDIPVERILFGSDWPHAEGIEQPRDFLAQLGGFSPRDQRRILRDNARELTFN